MAHISQNNGRPIAGEVCGSRGATYYLSTDGDGVISCTCIDWQCGKAARGKAIRDRICRHILRVLDGEAIPRPVASNSGNGEPGKWAALSLRQAAAPGMRRKFIGWDA